MQAGRGVLIFCFLSVFLSLSFAQTRNNPSVSNVIDSLEKSIAKAKTDTSKIRLLLSVSNFYPANDSLLAFQHCWEAMEIAKRLDNPGLEAKALNQIGKKYFDYSNSQKAITYYEKALEKADLAGDKIFKAKIYTNMGHAYHLLSKQDKALEMYLSAMKIYEVENDKRGMGRVYISLANVYSRMGQTETQKQVLFKGLKIAEETGDRVSQNACLINIGNYYIKVDSLEVALQYYREGAALSLELNNYQYYSNAIGNIGAVYGILGQVDSSLYYMRINLEMERKMGDSYSMVTSYTNMAATLQDVQKYKEALQYADSAEKISIKINYALGKKLAYEVYADVYHALGNDSAAYRYQILYMAAKDSIMSTEMNEKIATISQQFEQGKKNAEILALKERSRAQDLTLIFVAVAGFLVLLLAILLFKRNQLKQKANEQLGVQNGAIQMQKEIIEEKNRSITDSIHYAKRIQDNLLPTEKYIERSIRRMTS